MIDHILKQETELIYMIIEGKIDSKTPRNNQNNIIFISYKLFPLQNKIYIIQLQSAYTAIEKSKKVKNILNIPKG